MQQVWFCIISLGFVTIKFLKFFRFLKVLDCLQNLLKTNSVTAKRTKSVGKKSRVKLISVLVSNSKSSLSVFKGLKNKKLDNKNIFLIFIFPIFLTKIY